MKDKNTTDLARRQLVKLGAMLTAAEIVQLRQPVYGRPEAATTVGERLWLWSHVAGSYNDQYNLPGKSRITPAEAAYYMSIPNIFMIQLHDKPPIDSLQQYALALEPLKQVVWSVVDPQEVTPTAEREAVIELAFQTANITGVVMDDFFVQRESWNEGQLADLSIDELKRLKQRLNRDGERLDLWVVLYEFQLDQPVQQYLDLCDLLQVWTWYGKNLKDLEMNLEKVEQLAPRMRKVLGCFMWNFGEARPLPISLMKHQCELGLRWLQEGRIEAMVFCGSWLCDRGLESVEWTRQWIEQVGDQKVLARKAG